MPLLRLALAPLLALALMAGASPLLAQTAEPDIKVRQEADQTIREYRINGKLYAIRIEPKGGTAYFLVDRNGDGNFQRQDGNSVEAPSWVK